MSPVDFVRDRSSPLWAWLSGRMWSVEHAFEHARAQRREQDASYRIFFVLMAFATAFLMLAADAVTRAVWPQARPEAGASALPNARADLVDRNGQLLAVDLVHYGAYMDPQEVWDAAETRRQLLAAIPGLDGRRLDHAFATGRRVYLVGGLTPEQKTSLHDLGLPGVSFEEEDRRVYPLGPTAAHLIGFSDTGGRGLAGAERGLDKLAHEDAGAPVTLSIDLRVQSALDEELAKTAEKFQTIGAVGIIVDLHTGEILGLSSYPTYDPNEPGKSPPASLVNRVAAMVYEPGSVFKVFTLAMGLDAGVATPKTMFDARTPLAMGGGRAIHDYDKDNAMLPLWEVFTHSSNIGAARLGLLAGGERMGRYFKSFGLFAAAPSELVESARPITPRRLTDDSIASMSFGHAISVSPLAVATGMTAVLDGGVYRPLTIRKLDGPPAAGRRVIAEATSRTMLDLMRLNAIKGSGGTGGKADEAAPLLRVGGKTGSAEKAIGGHYERKKLVSSFAAVFPTDGPMDAPRYLVLIMLDEPHATKDTFGFATGGWTAAPTAGHVIDRIAPFLGVDRASLAEVDQENADLLGRYVGEAAAAKFATAADKGPSGDEE
jgi:cell division protein FtsI (penicillin-binding protein 3)